MKWLAKALQKCFVPGVSLQLHSEVIRSYSVPCATRGASLRVRGQEGKAEKTAIYDIMTHARV